MARKMQITQTIYSYCRCRLFLNNMVPLLLLVLLLGLLAFDLHTIHRALIVFLCISLTITSMGLAYIFRRSTNRHLRLLIDKQIQTAIQREHNRTAMALHETVTQLVFATSLTADAMLASENACPRDQLRKLRLLTAITHTAMRHALLDLRPAHMGDIPLNQLVSELVQIKQADSETEIQCVASGTARYPSEVHQALYRIVSLALSNSLLHAHASFIIVRLILDPDNAIVSIEDNGVGFDPENTKIGHFGLSDMHSHANSIGASLIFKTLPGSAQPKKIICIWRRTNDTHQIGDY